MPFDPPSSPPPASSPLARDAADRRAIARWLLLVAAMVWIMVALGGATRLTGSGLSIMEWAPLSGTLPPLTHAEWQRLYDLYRTIPQYELVNRGFGLEGFQRIFWLEWGHRLWGRLIGLAFLLPLVWFWVRGRVPAGLKPRLVLLFLLGGAQGAVGWFMVASGFAPDSTAVSPYRLVAHLGLALLLYAVLIWTAMSLLHPERDAPPAAAPLRRLAHPVAGLMVLAMLAGGFVAGLRAGLDYNTFPLMDGRLVPTGYAMLSPFWQNLTMNVAAVQFNHRLLATLAGAGALVLAVWGLRVLPPGRARAALLALGGTAVLQYALGVATLLLVVPAWLGTLHQAVAVAVLTAVLASLHALRRPRLPPGPG
ncbi:COX15/CtaA family protein [Roseomonas marmotae]|uniref:Heme A synthase n=1 Tax=Roseomonas marmotae TaxID=2768161 RepID=A0ABS3K9V4_9PROT|nr:COX15/CtaA family protein [Roseomonas marmotae]MBO1073116.1 COX15/CtaA family protein [Roseomonas marmotae]QTI79246.1 COX15/CtaA family protein [Roseomonas marmotae]